MGRRRRLRPFWAASDCRGGSRPFPPRLGKVTTVTLPILVDPQNANAWTEVSVGTWVAAAVLAGIGDPIAGSNLAQVDAVYPREKASVRTRSYFRRRWST